MGIIQVLSQELSHQIAAGEVVERPASVVKELVENALDAQAGKIDIFIVEGGQEQIQVSDDGLGIQEDDLQLAFMRHATSKIRGVDDLFAIHTLGFRGEALPSIASVSQLTLTSRAHNSDKGYRVTYRDGNAAVEPAGSRVGTTVDVRRLFYNTPARYKFLKSAASEQREITELVSHFALAHPHVAFHLKTDQKTIFQSTGSGDRLQALAAVYGWAHAKQMLPVTGSADWGTIGGFVSPPRLNRGNRGGQVLVLNGRVIRAPSLVYASERAYQGMLPQRRFPYFALNVKMDPACVDVNVHPAKTEVRFENERQVAAAVSAAVKNGLLGSDLSTPVQQEHSAAAESVRRYGGNAQAKAGRQHSLTFAAAAANDPAPDPWVPETWQEVDRLIKTYYPDFSPAALRPPLGRWTADTPQSTRALDKQTSSLLPSDHRDASVNEEPNQPGTDSHRVREYLLNGRILGQLYQTYILLETPVGLWILDQHIVHERILYERFLAVEKKRPPVQHVLPQTLEFPPATAQRISEQMPILGSLGIELEEFGPHSFLLRGIPQELSHDSKNWHEDIIRIVEAADGPGPWQEEAASTMACRGAIKAGNYLAPQQLRQLLERLAAAENPFTCPHGRPIILRFEKDKLARHFGR